MKFTSILALLAAAVPVVAEECETAYGQDGPSGVGNPQCFINPGWGADKVMRWGWVLDDITSTAQSFPVYAGAGQCDFESKGEFVGYVSVSVSGGQCTATFTATGTAYIQAMHFYCGNDPVPPNGFTSNGQFPATADPIADATSYSLTVNGVTGSPVYAIVHFEACGMGEEPPTGPPSPIGEGDPHFKTWNGKWFDYMGECDLKFVESRKFDRRHDLTINVRTTVAYDYSYIEAAAIQIGQDVLEVGSYGDYAVNGVDTPYLGGKASHIGGYPLVHTQVSKKKHTYDIILGPNENITLASYKQLVSVKINVGEDSKKFFGHSEGIIGSYTGDMLARDGRTIMEDTDAFGQEWQVTKDEPMIFRTPREPQHPKKCIMPAPSSTQRRLGETVAEEAAHKACAHLTGSSFNNCVYDVMAIGDLELAEAGTF